MENLFLTQIPGNPLPLRLIAIGRDKNQISTVRAGGYPAWHLMFTTGGTGMLTVKEGSYHIPTHAFFILEPNVYHSYTPDQEGWHTHWLVFDGRAAADIMRQFDLPVGRPGQAGPDFLPSCYQSVFRCAKTEGISALYQASAKLFEVLSGLSCRLHYKNLSEGYCADSTARSRLAQAMDYIHGHYNEDISLGNIAAAAGVTPQYINRIFQKSMRVSPYDYLIRHRIKEAKVLLSDSRRCIADVSEMSGFRDNSYFCAVFKKYEGVSASKFRRLFYNF